MEERIRELYQGGLGVKAIARELDLSRSMVRRRLISMGIYEGAGRASHKEEETTEQVFSFSITSNEEVIRAAENLDFPDLTLWTPRGDVSIVRNGDGWLIKLGAGFDAELCSPAMQGEWSGKGIEFSADLRLVSPAFGSLAMGIRDEGNPLGTEGVCFLTGGFVPGHYHLKSLCQTNPVLYLKADNYQAIVVHVSSLALREISTVGLKPVVLPEKKKLETGERIDLSWQGNGVDIFPCPWSPGALEIDFLNLLSTIYAPLIPETAGRKIKLTLKLRSLSGSLSLEVALGDDTGKATQQNLINREPCTWELERNVGKNGYVRILGRTYGREKTILEESFIEVVA